MKHLTIALAMGALLLLLCSNCSFMDKMYAAQKIDQVATPIKYTTLENYFVRNDVDCSKQQRLIIDNKAEFEKYFGMAAHLAVEQLGIVVILVDSHAIDLLQDGTGLHLALGLGQGTALDYLVDLEAVTSIVPGVLAGDEFPPHAHVFHGLDP